MRGLLHNGLFDYRNCQNGEWAGSSFHELPSLFYFSFLFHLVLEKVEGVYCKRIKIFFGAGDYMHVSIMSFDLEYCILVIASYCLSCYMNTILEAMTFCVHQGHEYEDAVPLGRHQAHRSQRF